jgi:hypothetical protein
MAITYNSLIKLAERRVASPRCHDHQTNIVCDASGIIKTITNIDKAGNAMFIAVITKDIPAKIQLLNKKNHKEVTIKVNKLGEILASNIKTPVREVIKRYNNVNGIAYANSVTNVSSGTVTSYKLDLISKKTYVRKRMTFDVIDEHTNKPTYGEVIKYTKGGGISARYIYLAGEKIEYRHAVSSDKDKMIITLLNPSMHWVKL